MYRLKRQFMIYYRAERKNNMVDNIIVDIKENNINENILKILLKDRTTKKNIIWATNDYVEFGSLYASDRPILLDEITGKNSEVIQPRITKNKQNQLSRTRARAEVFTPSWICNTQNNLIDEAWFGRKNVFNIENEKKWKSNKEKIEFPEKINWKEYVKLSRMEISCGEAPYLTSRYDTVTGKPIKIIDRVGLLDRKLRIVNENVDDKKEWIKWAKIAYKNIYGFEYQGDNLLIARENLFQTFIENYKYKFDEEPEEKDKKCIALIISWNIWQMDGITMTVPYCDRESLNHQITFEEVLNDKKNETPLGVECVIKDWKKEGKNEVVFKSIIGGK